MADHDLPRTLDIGSASSSNEESRPTSFLQMFVDADRSRPSSNRSQHRIL
ncbi:MULTISPECIES: hypothetical protein [unclassified Rhodococcus (in: high G+C Gram-positive bacteria)]|nr:MULTISPECIES: hypothetical protein [unclassified Rhodococcus (in: high G+C Gram-positive bacteria)]